MNERLTIQNLIDFLASKHNMSKKDAEAFVKEFFLLIEQALENENYVKIKGLGTFKLIEVDRRESVNVNTGERFQIEGHTKVSFIPETNLKETINKPFAHFETVMLHDKALLEEPSNEEPESDFEDETEEKEEEINTVSEKTEVEIENKKEEDEVNLISEEPTSALETKAEDSVDITAIRCSEEEKANTCCDVKEIIEQKDKVAAEEITAREFENSNENNLVSESNYSSKTSEKKIKKEEKSSIFYLVGIIATTLLICGGVILFIYYPNLFSFSSSDKNNIDLPMNQSSILHPEVVLSDTLDNKQDTIIQTSSDSLKEDIQSLPLGKKEPVTKETDSKKTSASIYQDSATYIITGTKTTHTIKEGETLNKVALHYYGTKALWPYIVKHNPGVIKNPDNVPYGTKIKIPELSK